MYDHLPHSVYVKAAVGSGDVQKAGTRTKSSGISSGVFGEQMRGPVVSVVFMLIPPCLYPPSLGEL